MIGDIPVDGRCSWVRAVAFGLLIGTPASADHSPEVVRTDNYEIHLSPVGGRPLLWDILDPAAIEDGAGRISLVNAESLRQGRHRPFEVLLPEAVELNEAIHQVERLDDDDDGVLVRFTSPATPAGLRWIRTYRIPRSGFETRLGLKLVNEGTERIDLDPGLRLGPGLGVEQQPAAGLGGGLYSYVRPVYKFGSDVESPSLSDKEPQHAFGDESSEIAWGGIHDRYFAAVLAPDLESGDRFRSGRAWLSQRLEAENLVEHESQAARLFFDLFGEPLSLAPGGEVELSYTFFFGPKERRVLQSTRFGLTDILFPGLWEWLRWLCFILMSMLSGFHAILHSWGLSLIALAVAIRLLTFPIAQVGLKQQAAMAADQARLKPYVVEINEKYKDDAGRRSKELMRLYEEHGVNPFAAFKGCFWVLLQVPIFVALFNIIGQAFELRGAGFLWLRDLSEPDRLFSLGIDLPLLGGYFNLLPILMAGTQVVVTHLSLPPEADPSESAKQKKFMFAMAILFLLLFYSFPSGLVLYWTVANLGQYFQQRIMAWRGARAAAETR